MRILQYILDANVFIEAARRYYAFDLAPRFWEWLEKRAAQGVIRSIDRVKTELLRGNDELAAWARQVSNVMFDSTDQEDVLARYAEVMGWVQSQKQYSDAAKAEFAAAADGWLVAYALARGCIVVTHEISQPLAKRRVPITNVCQGLGVNFTNTFEMLRNLGFRFP